MAFSLDPIFSPRNAARHEGVETLWRTDEGCLSVREVESKSSRERRVVVNPRSFIGAAKVVRNEFLGSLRRGGVSIS